MANCQQGQEEGVCMPILSAFLGQRPEPCGEGMALCYSPGMRDRLLQIADIFLEYHDPGTSLLDYSNAFQLLVAVTLSAQTTDAQVNKVLPRLFERFPGPPELARAEIEDIEEIIHSLGFFRTKARNIRAAAALLVSDYGGRVPDQMEDLLRLPGIGRKSAGVVLYHIYNKPAIIVDTHFSRVNFRLGFAESRDPLKVESALAALLPPERWGEYSMTANLHGRRFCHSRAPDCENCPVSALCPSAAEFLNL